MANKDYTWETLSYEEKNHQLFLRQKELLDLFLKKKAITKEQHDTYDLQKKEKVPVLSRRSCSS